MVITRPHAFGLAVPLVVAINTSASAKKGLLIRNRTAFENSRKITLLVFDKTGTLTKGNFAVSRYGAFSDDYDDKKMIQNFVWASAYNIVTILLAAGVLFTAGIMISPAPGAILMSMSTVIVSINALLLKWKMKRA